LLNIDNIINLFQRILAEQMQKIEGYAKYLFNVSPERNLKLGYSILRDETGKVLKSIKQVKVGQSISAVLADGNLESTIKIIK